MIIENEWILTMKNLVNNYNKLEKTYYFLNKNKKLILIFMYTFFAFHIYQILDFLEVDCFASWTISVIKS